MKNKTNKNIQPLIDVALFAILIFSFHFFFRWWAYGDNKYWPIADIIYPVYDFLSNLLYVNSRWVLSHLTTIDFSFNDSGTAKITKITEAVIKEPKKVKKSFLFKNWFLNIYKIFVNK